MNFPFKKYETLIANYKVLIVVRIQWLLLTHFAIIIPLAAITIAMFTGHMNYDDEFSRDYTKYFFLAFVVFGILWLCKSIWRRKVIEIDNSNNTINLRYNVLFDRKEILYLKVENEESGGYYYDYLSFVTEDKAWRIARLNSIFGSADELGKLIAEKTGLELIRK